MPPAFDLWILYLLRKFRRLLNSLLLNLCVDRKDFRMLVQIAQDLIHIETVTGLIQRFVNPLDYLIVLRHIQGKTILGAITLEGHDANGILLPIHIRGNMPKLAARL